MESMPTIQPIQPPKRNSQEPSSSHPPGHNSLAAAAPDPEQLDIKLLRRDGGCPNQTACREGVWDLVLRFSSWPGRITN